MTRQGPTRRADDTFGAGRLENARSFHELAEQALTLAAPGQNANPILSLVVSSAIGYADAVCSLYGGRVNQDDHDAAPKTLRAVLGNQLPPDQLKRFRRILAQKDQAQYGARWARLEAAQERMEDLRQFAEWAMEMMANRR
ncbi:MAG TPA: hypothetical protein VMN60_07335 [Longimicrobiales bacterium]|nr:hypothetical protein [Longimicrobiales bacterium]